MIYTSTNIHKTTLITNRKYTTRMLLQILLAGLVSKLALAKSDGAPSGACFYMLPGHTSNTGIHGVPINHQPISTSRFTINATWEESHRYVRLTITGSTLKGFLIQARHSEEGEPVGSFNINGFSNETKYQNCTQNKFNPKASITHGDPSIKQNVSVLWEPPKTGSGNITFYATIVQSYDVFWLKLPSNAINLSGRSRGSSFSKALFSNITVFLATLLLKNVFNW